MPATPADVVLHIDANTTHAGREQLRKRLLATDGVLAASCHDATPHLLVVVYIPDAVNSSEFVNAAGEPGLHAELMACSRAQRQSEVHRNHGGPGGGRCRCCGATAVSSARAAWRCSW